MQSEKLELSQEWDKVFPQSDAVEHEKVTFVNRFGITLAADLHKPKNVAAQRTVDYRASEYLRAGGVVDPVPEDAPQFVKDYHDYYKPSRGYHERSGNSTDGWNATSNIPWANTNLLQFAHEIESAVMMLHGEKAHSRYMGERIYEKLKGDNKELLIVEGASHCDLYDGGDDGVIPWNAITAFFDKNLK